MMKKFNHCLPTEIISEILICLPAESVLESKLLCKTWNNLIHHPSFPQRHLDRLNHQESTGKLSYIFLKTSWEVDFDVNDDEQIYNFEYNDNEELSCVEPVRRKFMLEIPFENYIVIGSINGLICVFESQPNDFDAHGPACIFNPVTREYVVLPGDERFPEILTRPMPFKHLASGFGYVASTNEYKVVKIYVLYTEPNVVEVEVYTVGSGKGWRHIGKFDFGFRFYPHFRQTHGVFLNGCLHWRSCLGGMVVVFDLADEKFHKNIPPPPMLMEEVVEDEEIDVFTMIGVSGGGILYYAACQSVIGGDFDNVWLLMKKNIDDCVMKEQEEHQSWGWIEVTSLEQREPFGITCGGNVLRYHQGYIKVFHSITSTWENLEDFRSISRQVFPHKHTLASLKEFGEEDVKIMKPRESEETGSCESGGE